MITLLKNVIPAELTQKIRARCAMYLDVNSYSFNHTYNRAGKTVTVGKTPELQDLDEELAAFIRILINRSIVNLYRPSFGVADTGYEFHRYEAGDFCLVHADEDVSFEETATTSLLRFATIILHLNTVSEGGETIFPNQNKKYKTIEGQILIFPPTGLYPHYTTPANETRDILMTWLVHRDIRVVEV